MLIVLNGERVVDGNDRTEQQPDFHLIINLTFLHIIYMHLLLHANYWFW
jgi:hypothetical protein